MKKRASEPPGPLHGRRVRCSSAVIVALIVAVAMPGGARAQQRVPPAVHAAQRALISTIDLRTERIATLDNITSDSVHIVYTRDFGETTLAWNSVRTLALSEGQSPSAQLSLVAAAAG